MLLEFWLFLYQPAERFMLHYMFSFDVQACFLYFLLTLQVICNN
jgi:hypothetical protein